MNIYFVSLLLLFGAFQSAYTQKFANKKHYLVDSLSIEKINTTERKLLDSCITIFHSVKSDTSKVSIINHLVESSYDNKLWPKYNTWIFKFCEQQLSKPTTTPELLLYYSKAKAGAINNFGYLNQIHGENAKAIDQYTKSMSIYKKMNDTIGVANALNNIGSVHYYTGNSIESLRLYHESLHLRKLINDNYGITNSLNNIGNIYRTKANYKEDIECFLESLKYRLLINDNSYTSTLYHNIGLCYMDMNNTEKSLEYLNKALTEDTKAGNISGKASSLKNIGHCHQKTKNHKNALQLFNESLVLFKEIDSKKEIGATLNSIAETKLALNHNTSEILALYKQSLTIFKAAEYLEGLGNTYSGLANTYLKTQDYVAAEKYAKKHLAIAKQIDSKTAIKNSYTLLSEIFEKQKNYKNALQYSKLTSVYNDSINNELAKNTIDIKQIKFQYEQDLLLSKNNLKHKIALVQTKNTSQKRIIIITLISLAFILSLLIILYYKLKVNKKQKNEIELKNKKLLKMYAELERTYEDKTFLLKEIHHRVKNNLQVITSILRMQDKFTDDENVSEVLKNSRNRINSMALIHEKLYKVDSLSLINYNNYINELVTFLIQTYNKEEDNIDFTFHSEPLKFTSETAIPIGLLLNEIISNTLKHAFTEQDVKKIYLSISKKDNNQYEMLIGDNGIGSDNQIKNTNNSLGVKLIHTMVRQLKGTIEQVSKKPGTHYKITFEAN